MNEKILVLNIGSTSTKIAVYLGNEEQWRENVPFDPDKYPGMHLKAQIPDRTKVIMEALLAHGDQMRDFDIIVSRGCGSKPVGSGAYILSELMIEDAYQISIHPNTVGCDIAYSLGKEYGIPAIEVDTTVIDELCEEARFSGMPEIVRHTGFHALNQRAVVREYCRINAVDPEKHNFIVAHMGGGVTVGAHRHGRIIDVNWGAGGEGPFAMDRAGHVQLMDFAKLCYSGEYTYGEMIRKICTQSGVAGYLGESDGIQISMRIENGDRYAEKVIQAFAYQISKEIGALAAVLKGDVKTIILTGGLANWKYLTSLITERVSFIAPVYLRPGENENAALAAGALRVLRGEETAETYPYEKSETQNNQTGSFNTNSVKQKKGVLV